MYDVENRPSLEKQIEQLEFYRSKGLYWEITEDKFPDLPATRVAIARFFTTDDAIDALQSAARIAEDDQLKRTFLVMASKLIAERDQYCLNLMPPVEGEPDFQALQAQARFRQVGDASRMMELAMNMGLIEMLNGQNFPALRALPGPQQEMIRIMALRVRKATLEGIRADLRQMPNRGVEDPQMRQIRGLRHRLDQQIKEVHGQLLDCLENILPEG